MPNTSSTETAILGGGCFWCIDAAFRELTGVTEVVSGYAGGHVPNPSYEQVCGKQTGHAEVVKLTFDPAVVSYADILRIFFTLHDPTTKDRQGADVGPQYRSIILTLNEEQERTAREVIAELDAQGLWPAPIVTEVVPAGPFWPAEPEHQDYFVRNPWSGYCRVVVAPKVAKFRKSFADRLKTHAA
ncbi:peptide-methionine (S)-S-oxide reductase MsrA [Roseomonas marmotae]|uniref:Peptide methionine sulfoxide reductase MsrA n=1 Tax=Roseomonas marmotae TaxID=2768161 RepID=A0ABS3KAE0_9PROT|nr:peptide-methionine (S)-S-oxide reductase MsrA [Roseomonas marmotae]MBO1074412.1 peptide-methionine (S)-S-oxide reductase MsrA [Roseomonas marmotae]QTI78152.1 peptide-methionine (S)-S-oxide reductase MsrA [Roseomonas marmotae]